MKEGNGPVTLKLVSLNKTFKIELIVYSEQTSAQVGYPAINAPLQLFFIHIWILFSYLWPSTGKQVKRWWHGHAILTR